jgi:hypothetical protein
MRDSKQSSAYWWLVYVDGKHVSSWASRSEAQADAAERESKNRRASAEVRRGDRKRESNGGGFFVNM